MIDDKMIRWATGKLNEGKVNLSFAKKATEAAIMDLKDSLKHIKDKDDENAAEQIGQAVGELSAAVRALGYDKEATQLDSVADKLIV